MSEAGVRTVTVETPSGKGAGDENFPVGSILIARHLRPHVGIFYRFARTIDDIADNPALAPDDKIARLDACAAAVTGDVADGASPAALQMRASLVETAVPARHCLDLISAFKQDAVKARYADWDELIDYCNRSASPVGRYLLDLHGEDPALWPANDALCNALQVINHLQDCGKDYREMNRIYLPQDWMAREGARDDELAGAALSPALRRVLDRCLDGCRTLDRVSAALPRRLVSRRLGAETSVILTLARRLVRQLGRRDPLAERVELTKPEVLACSIAGLWAAMTGSR